MKTLNLEGMEKIQGGDCFDTMFAAAGSFWDCGSNGSNGACAVATAYIFYLMDSCFSI